MEGISRNNRIPGSDKLTRPEEIDGLGKFLRNVKKVQDEHTELGDTSLGVPRQTIPEIKTLEGTIESLEVKEEIGLYDTILGLDDTRSVTLEGVVEKLSKENKEVNLGTEKETLDDNRDNFLEIKKENLDLGDKEEKLDTIVETLETSSKIELSENLETIEDNYKPSLETDIQIIRNQKTESLETEIKTIEDNVKPDLRSDIDEIIDTKEPELNVSKDRLNVKEDLKDLGGITEKIEVESDVNLEENLDKLYGKIDPELKETKEEIEVSDNIGLTSILENILFASEEKENYFDNNPRTSKSELKETLNKDVPENKEIPEYKNVEEITPRSTIENLYKNVLSTPDTSDSGNYFDNTETSRETGLYSNKLGTPDSDSGNYFDNNLVTSEEDDLRKTPVEEIQENKKKGSKFIVPLDVEDDSGKDRHKYSVINSRDFTELSNILKSLGIDYIKLEDSKQGNTRGYTWADIVSKLKTEDLYSLTLLYLRNNKRESGIENLISAIISSHLSESEPERERLFSYIQELDKVTDIANYSISASHNQNRPRAINSSSGDIDNSGMPGFKMPEVQRDQFNISGGLGNLNIQSSFLDSMNTNKYLRWAAEELMGKINFKGLNKGASDARRLLLEETLAMLVAARDRVEALTRSSRDRLPGDDLGLISDLVSGGASKVVGEIIDTAESSLDTLVTAGINGSFDSINKEQPLNRPVPKVNARNILGHGNREDTELEETTAFELGNNRIEGELSAAEKAKSFGNYLGKSLVGFGVGSERTYSFADNYLKGKGIQTTLSDLCKNNFKNMSSVVSLEGLKDILINGDYITTPKKFGTIGKGQYGSTLLDNNAYWEIIMEPYCGDINGNYSFLPDIREINTINKVEHGVFTGYNKWIPVSNFELQKSKLTTKTLNLFDGEINYPVAMEFTNEFRMTVVDDQFKSWRNYFQKCVDVSVYSSLPHKKDYYTSNDIEPTPVDRRNIVVAFYKNVTFLITVYIMTPQYSTVRKLELLCVIKDFSEEFSGEIEPSSADLNVAFSIVGENPPKSIEKAKIEGPQVTKTNNYDEDNVTEEKYDPSQNPALYD